MATTARLRLLGAFLLLGALALPQSTCAGYRAPNGEFVTTIPRGASTDAYQPTIRRDYAFDRVHAADPGSWLAVAVFLWPFPLMAIAARARSERLRAYICVASPVLALIAGCSIWVSAGLFATPALGAYVAIAGLGVFFAASVVELWRAWRAPAVAVESRLTSA